MTYREKILTLARAKPLLPVVVARELETNSIMAGAMLSEMCGKGLLKTSTLKVGGSPLYYMPGNESQLLNHLESLNEKDRRTVLKLKEEKIIREVEADPLTQVSLTQVKDFAKPLTVVLKNRQETFWKWFELSDDDAKQAIKNKLEPQTKQKTLTVPVKTKPPKPVTPKIEEKHIQKPLPETSKLEPAETQKITGEFWDQVQNFFTKNSIKMLEHKIIKRKTDYDLIIEVPSPVGTLAYYCKARNKKRISDADISAAYVQGQIKKLPVIFITLGELTKQAKETLSQLKGITLKKI
jgi:hypothetical protein